MFMHGSNFTRHYAEVVRPPDHVPSSSVNVTVHIESGRPRCAAVCPDANEHNVREAIANCQPAECHGTCNMRAAEYMLSLTNTCSCMQAIKLSLKECCSSWVVLVSLPVTVAYST